MTGVSQPRDLVLGEFAPFTRLEAGEREPRVAAPVQPDDRVPDGLAHPLDLVLAALVEGQLEAARREAADLCRRRAAVLELDALGEPPQSLVVQFARDVRLVDLLDLVARMREPVRQRPVVREQERARGVGVEAADRDDPRLVPDEVDDRRTALRIACGGDDAGRLVEKDVREPLRLDSLPVQFDDVARGDEGVQLTVLPVDANAAGLDEVVGASPRSDASAREIGVQPQA
jgi:hypothetical protein